MMQLINELMHEAVEIMIIYLGFPTWRLSKGLLRFITLPGYDLVLIVDSIDVNEVFEDPADLLSKIIDGAFSSSRLGSDKS